MTLPKIQETATGITRASLESARQQLQLLEEYVSEVLRKDQDYGQIPGTNSKPTLLKPGASNVIIAFNCHSEPCPPQITLDRESGFVSFIVQVNVVHNDTGLLRAKGFGECNSYETKYRYREQKRVCPSCGTAAIIKGKKEWGGGWTCWRRQGGCGEKYSDGDVTIEAQATGRIENPDPLDQTNTYLKMAIKRAEVDAALRLPGVARFFTQDLEDMQDSQVPPPEEDQETTPDNPTPDPITVRRRSPAQKPASPQPTAETQERAYTFDQLKAAVEQAGMTWEGFEFQVLGNGRQRVLWAEWTNLGGTADGARQRWERWQAQHPQDDSTPEAA